MSLKSRIVLVSSIIAVFCCSSVYAYLDPGAGSSLIQGIIAAVLIFSTTISILWGKIKGLFKKEDQENQGK